MALFYVLNSPEYNTFDFFPIICMTLGKKKIICYKTMVYKIGVSARGKMKVRASRKMSICGREEKELV